ncbi:MAG: geranylgeranyl reductase family protein [Acidobacteriaceae bacterium]|nr:geranylgeranyl reductase family protein [Acidobacteriaceae bacterium]
MPHDYDVLIAGAGPAGCAAAFDLAEAGRRVLLLDKRHFPRHKACACGLTRKTLAALRYPVDAITERVCEEIVLQRASGAQTVADKTKELRVRSDQPIAAMAVRERFDAYCLEQTLRAGHKGGSVALRKIENILKLEERADSVSLTVMTGEGPITLEAPVVIGADGSNGQMRRLSTGSASVTGQEPEWYTRGFALEAMVPYASLPAELPQGDAPLDLVFDFAPIPGGYGWLFPKGDHINIGVGAFAPSETDSTDNLGLVTRRLLAEYTQCKLGVDLTALGAEITGQYLGMGGDRYQPKGRVLLVGDAAGLVDPLTGEGIHSALVSGQAAAAAILGAPHAIAEAYAHHLEPLQQTLRFSRRAAKAFYREPERGFRVMRWPMLRRMVLKTYADGLGGTGLLAKFAKLAS